MSADPRKLATLLTVVAIAVVAFVLLKPDDDDTPAGAPVSTPTVPAKTPPATTATKPAPRPAPAPSAAVVRTRGGALVGAVKRVVVDKGETVRIDVTSDIAEEVHVHGYDREFTIPAGGRAKLRFPATIDGRFEIELHGSGTQIAELTVNP